MSEKERFMQLATKPGVNMSRLCRDVGITRRTGYLLVSRYRREGPAGLMQRSRKPATCAHKTPEAIEAFVLQLRDAHPGWGGVKIAAYLTRQGYSNMPCAKTLNRILKRYGRINPTESEKHRGWKRFEHAHPNDLWQMDFKGHFVTQGGNRCHPLTLLDDHSRFCLTIRSCGNEQGMTVKPELIRLFKTYGLPKRMTMDNGAPWGYSGNQLHTWLTAWLIRLGIYVSHSRPCHPQTQGKLERFHRTLKLELLSLYQFEDLGDAQQGFDWWRQLYNEERPHEGIKQAVPSDRYRASDHEYPDKLKPIDYDRDYQVRKVQGNGEIYFKGKVYRVGQAFYGCSVGLKEGDQDGLMDVYFCHQKVLTIDLQQPIKK